MPDVAGRILDGQVGQIQARQMAVLPQRGDRRGAVRSGVSVLHARNAGMLSWTISACKMAADSSSSRCASSTTSVEPDVSNCTDIAHRAESRASPDGTANE